MAPIVQKREFASYLLAKLNSCDDVMSIVLHLGKHVAGSIIKLQSYAGIIVGQLKRKSKEESL